MLGICLCNIKKRATADDGSMLYVIAVCGVTPGSVNVSMVSLVLVWQPRSHASSEPSSVVVAQDW